MFGGTRYASNGILLNADSKGDAAMFQYEFRFEDTELSYKYSRLSNQELREEELSVNGKSIRKAAKVQKIDVNENDIRKQFDRIELFEILNIQNEVSRNLEKGFIWVLSTCVLLIAEYNFNLIR